jgi:hypothetical protein
MTPSRVTATLCRLCGRLLLGGVSCVSCVRMGNTGVSDFFLGRES